MCDETLGQRKGTAETKHGGARGDGAVARGECAAGEERGEVDTGGAIRMGIKSRMVGHGYWRRIRSRAAGRDSLALGSNASVEASDAKRLQASEHTARALYEI
jgi:hypothetical protein